MMYRHPKMTERQQGLARRVSVHDAFLFLCGASMMRDGLGFRDNLRLEHVSHGPDDSVTRTFAEMGAIPNLNDPATIGTLAWIVRQAVGKGDRCLETIEDIIDSEWPSPDPSAFTYAKTREEVEACTEGERWAMCLLRLPTYGKLKVYQDREQTVIAFAESLESAASGADMDESDLIRLPSWQQVYEDFDTEEDVPKELMGDAYALGENEGEGGCVWRVEMAAHLWAAYHEKHAHSRVVVFAGDR